MNDLKPLEDQLRSWAPRPPSRKLEQRIFRAVDIAAAVESKVSEAPAARYRWHWWAPAMATMAAVMMVFSQKDPLTVLAEPSTGLVTTAMIALPGAYAEVYVAAHHRDNNTWPQATFEWTNRSYSLTTSPPFAGTNSLLQ